VLEVLVDQRRRVIDNRSVTGQQPLRCELPHEPEGRQVSPQVTALLRGNDDGASLAREIAAVKVSGLAIEETEVVGRMTRGRNDLELAVAGRNGTAGRVHDQQTAPPVAQRRKPLDVVGMPVGDEHAHERRATQRPRHRLDVLGIADSGVDERGLAAG
jgi:hypothetical protein